MAKVPAILKTFYDRDIVEEDVLIEWDSKASKKYVSKEISKEIHTKASPFITWLKEAEEESSDEEEEDEEDVEVVYSSTGKVGTETIPKDNNQSTNADNDDGEDEIDIDDI